MRCWWRGFALLFLTTVAFAQPSLKVKAEDLGEIPIKSQFFIPSDRVVGDKIYFFGGLRAAGNPIQAQNDIYSFDLNTETFTRLAVTMPYEASNSQFTAAVPVGGTFYLSPSFATGNSTLGTHNRVIAVDPARVSAAEMTAFPMSTLWGSGGTEANGKVYFFGGWSGWSPVQDIFEFNPATGSITKVAKMVQDTNEVVATLGADGWIYYWGRLHSGRRIERFNPTTRQVQQLKSVLPWSEKHPAYVRWHLPEESAIYLFEGKNGSSASSAVYKFDYSKDTLTNTGVRVDGTLVNQRSPMDATASNVIYAYRIRTDLNDRLMLTRLTLQRVEEGDDIGGGSGCGASCDWARAADTLTARLASAAGVAVVRDKITVVGHHDQIFGTGRLNEEFDPQTNTWRSKTQLPRTDGRQGMAAGVIGDNVYFFGGANVNNNYHTQTVDKYNPVSDSWTLGVGTYPQAVSNAAAVGFGDKVYTFGGNNFNAAPTNRAYRFDPANGSFTAIADMPVNRSFAKAFVHEGKIWLAGGHIPNANPSRPQDFRPTIDIYDPTLDQWSSGPRLPISAAALYFAGVLGDGKIYVVYGDGDPSVYVYDARHQTWSYICTAPLAQKNYGVAAISNVIFTIGGGEPKVKLVQAVQVRGGVSDDPPTLEVPPSMTVTNDTGYCHATVDPGQATGSSECGEVVITAVRDDGLPLDAPYPTGNTVITWTATDQSGQQTSGDQVISVLDSEDPKIIDAAVDRTELWPPRHEMIDIVVSYNSTDNCGVAKGELIVTSNEPINGLGDGDVDPDWEVVNEHLVRLRAERSGNGDGRIYTITIRVKDVLGNVSTQTLQVRVPRNRR